MRILIAEDDGALARFVRQGLEGEHYSVDVFPDGEQARNAATQLDYDVVILDLNLPTLDGVNVLRHRRSKKPSLPVLVLTSVHEWRTGLSAWIWARTTTWPNHFPSASFPPASGLLCGAAICLRSPC